MEFDTAERAILRGEGNGIPVPANTGVAVDAEDRVYALEAGCSNHGVVHILRADFSEIRAVAVGQCATQIVLALVPPAGTPPAEDPPL
jgi:nitrite reductase/ring-hydroxylating ferredoxin subunit